MCTLIEPLSTLITAGGVVLLAVAAVIAAKIVPAWFLAGRNQEDIRFVQKEFIKVALYLAAAVLLAALPTIIGWFPGGADLLARCG